MEDESGQDEKILAVPVDKLDLTFSKVKEITDLPEATLNEIKHFFERYKDLEPGKWVKVKEFKGVEEARKLIMDSVERAGKETT